MRLWIIILGAGLITFALRLAFIVLLERIHTPDWFQRALRFVPIAVLSAIALPDLVSKDGALDISYQNPQLLAGILAVYVSWRTKNVLLTIGVGLVSLLVFQVILR